MKKLYRSKDVMIGGVCAGIAEYMGIDKTVVRVGYTILTLITGGLLGIAAYVACMFIIPVDDDIIDG